MAYITTDEMPLPVVATHQMQISGGNATNTPHTNPFLAGISPFVGVGRFARIRRAWCVFGSNDTSADGSNNTQVDFRVGTIASYTQVATLKTKDITYNLGDVLSKTLNFVVPRDKPLFVYITRNGTGSQNMASKSFYFGFDIVVEEA